MTLKSYGVNVQLCLSGAHSVNFLSALLLFFPHK